MDLLVVGVTLSLIKKNNYISQETGRLNELQRTDFFFLFVSSEPFLVLLSNLLRQERFTLQ